MSAGGSPTPALVVGVGASAGGLQALEAFLRAVPADLDAAFVVVQHLSPEHESSMPELLEKRTQLRVERARDGAQLAAGVVHVITPGCELRVVDWRLRVAPYPEEALLHLPVDVFLTSLARDVGERAIAVILSGSGSDGVRGVRAVKEAGGYVIIQEPREASFDGMPTSALTTGVVDASLPAAGIGDAIARIADGPLRAEPVPLGAAENGAVARILELIEQRTGRDFRGYKRSTLLRRIERRMQLRGVRSVEKFAVELQDDREEVLTLCREFLIGVTRFFRDPEAFDLISEHVVPGLLEADDDGPLRVWCAGCATGEEAYSLAMLLVEAMQERGISRDLRVFATDVDEDALAFAGAGVYPASIVADVSPERLDRFFVGDGDDYRIGKWLRAKVVFAAHDVLSDPPLTSMRLISCRNLLIYLEKPQQERALRNFGYALRTGGYLFLGPSESLGDLAPAFDPVERKWKIFRRNAAGVTLQPSFGRFSGLAAPTGGAGRLTRHAAAVTGAAAEVEEILRVVAEQLGTSCVVVDREGLVLHVIGDVGRFLKLQTGKASMDLAHLTSRELYILLSGAMRRAAERGHDVVYRGPLGRGPSDDVSLRVTPHRLRGQRDVFLIAFEHHPESDESEAVAEDLGPQSERVQVLEEELRHTRENLQAMIEELETSNEELQATNEELMSSNEELHAMNEELQSVNEELHTVNAEYQKKIQELTQLKDDIDNLLRSTGIGTLFLDPELRIRSFTPSAVRYVSLMNQDIGRPIDHLTSHLLDVDLRVGAQQVLDEGRIVEQDGRSARHDEVLVRFRPYESDESSSAGGVVITFVDVSEIQRARRRLQQVIDSMPSSIAVLDRRGDIVLVNAAWRRFAEAAGAADSPSLTVGACYLDACRPIDGEARAAVEGLQAVLNGERQLFRLEYPCHSATQKRWFWMVAARLEGDQPGAVVTHLDVTDWVAERRSETTT